MRGIFLETGGGVMTVVPILSPDRQLERDIEFARARMQSCFRSRSAGLARVWFEHLQKLVASRSPERVAEIEQKRGLNEMRS
jgi:hypothetical protein